MDWTWGTKSINFCDPMSGGGSIPFEALRYGLGVSSNELNSIATVVLEATLDYPARYGPDFVDDILKYGRIWSDKTRGRLSKFFADLDDDAMGACFLWARTVACPESGKPVPLATNWWLRKGPSPMAVRLVASTDQEFCGFHIVRGAAACKQANPDKGTVKRGTAVSPWTGSPIDGEYIKAQSKAGKLGFQLYAVGVKKHGDFDFREPTAEDTACYNLALDEWSKVRPKYESLNLIPVESRREGRADWACEIYGLRNCPKTRLMLMWAIILRYTDRCDAVVDTSRAQASWVSPR